MAASGIEHATLRLVAQGEPKYLGGGPIAVSFFHHKSETDLGTNTCLRSKRPVSDRLRHGAVICFVKLHIVSKQRLGALYIIHV